jgi:PAS domain S-box-containing protein
MTSANRNHSMSETILIVDDNRQVALYVKDLLTGAGFKSLIAGNGRSALDILNQNDIDLVLLDVIMPDLDGITVAKKMKEIASGSFLPVILVTALTTGEHKVVGLTHADGYITKPFSVEELLACVNSLLRIRRLHNELSKSKKRSEYLYEHFPHLYISIDSRKNISDCNLFFRQTLKVNREEIVGKSIFSIIKEEDRPVLDHFLDSLVSNNMQVQQRVFNLILPSGEFLVINMRAVYIGEENEGLSTVIAMEDVTEQLRLQEEQKIARKQLYRSARLASVGTLASGVAHEMNNPLTAILGFSSALLDRIKSMESIGEDDLQQYLSIINAEALRCRDIVENLSRFAREGDFLTTPIKLYNCITDALKLVHPKLVRNNITVKNTIPSEIKVRADGSRLEQVFVNVFSNCIDFCGENSMIMICEGHSREPLKYFCVHISDNGPGIAPENLPVVFDPFFTTKEVGKGMGLAICHKLMEENNGNIDIVSERGRGTTVIIEIPVYQEIGVTGVIDE